MEYSRKVWSILSLCLILATPSVLGQVRGIDPCNPSPCGPNTYCTNSHTGAAVCRCLAGYFPKPDTITGCGHQCDFDTQCLPRERCFGNKCQAACQPGICGVNADCEAQNHRVVCKCLRGYTGDPLTQCTQLSPVVRRIVSQPTAPLIRDACAGNPCGQNTECYNSGDRPVCSCLPNHRGDPYKGCRRGECESNSECPFHNVCQNFVCVNPCASACGFQAQCNVRNHIAHCSCPPGWTGDPSRSCRIYDENELCQPTPCGSNTKCRVEAGRAICSCLPTYIGNPLSGCRRECESDGDCAFHQGCIDYKCRDPCAGACGQYATCEVRNHAAVCSCPKDFLGEAYTRCFPECTSHAECPANRACIGLKCGDPCAGACGTNAECRVDKSTHKAICSCPRGYTGHPFESCRPYTPADLCTPGICGENARCDPGYDNSGRDRPVCSCPPGFVGDALVRCNRGECLSDAECGRFRICKNYVCENPCQNACGVNADCEVRNGAASCSCPRNFRGDPFRQCTAEPVRGRRQSKDKPAPAKNDKKAK